MADSTDTRARAYTLYVKREDDGESIAVHRISQAYRPRVVVERDVYRAALLDEICTALRAEGKLQLTEQAARPWKRAADFIEERRSGFG